MQTTRRNFLQSFAAAAALVTSGGLKNVFGQKTASDLFPLPVEVYSEPFFSMTMKQFESYRGQIFSIRGADGREIQAVLSEVNRLERLGNSSRGYYGESFSLIFETDQKTRLAQGTYDLTTDGLSSFTALVVPTGLPQRQYEVIVNHVGR